jgi:SAM-dependent methyltransferase
MRSTPDSINWWAALYDDVVADVLLEDTSHVATTVTFLVRELGLQRGDRVFDQCCGTGRLSVALARWGAQVIGVEQAARYVERARIAAVGLDATFVAGDAFAYAPDNPCRAAINWWTSFGYLTDDAGNARMLQRAFEALVAGGRFAIDFPNAPNVARTFRPREVTTRGDLEIIRESSLDLVRGLMHKRWTLGNRHVDTTLRLYAPDQLIALLASVGFCELRAFGGVDGSPLTLESSRCIVVGVKP